MDNHKCDNTCMDEFKPHPHDQEYLRGMRKALRPDRSNLDDAVRTGILAMTELLLSIRRAAQENRPHD